MRRTETGIVIAGLIGALATIVGLAGLSISSGEASLESNERIRATSRRLLALEQTWADLNRAESARRGYALTKDAAHLDQYHEASTEIRMLELELRASSTLTSGRSRRRLERLIKAIDRRVDSLDRALSTDQDPIGQTVLGTHTMSEVRAEMVATIEREQDALTAQAHTAEAHASWLRHTLLLGASISAASILLVFGLLFREIKRRQLVESVLSEKEARLRRLVDANIIGVFTSELEGPIIESNQAFLDLVGHDRRDVEEQRLRWGSLTPERWQAQDVEKRRELLDKGAVEPFEKELLRADGSSVPVLIGATMLPSASHYLAFVLDLSERKAQQGETERAKEKLDLKVKELQARTREIEQLSKMGGLLHSLSERSEAYRIAAHFSQRILPGTSGVLCVIKASGNFLETVAGWGDVAVDEAFEPEDCWALRRGRPHPYTLEGTSDLGCTHHEPMTGDALCIPLMAQSELIGLLHVRAPTQTALTDAQTRLALAVAETTALVISNLKLQEELRTQAIRDPLTGLFNRRYLEESLERELERARRRGSPASVLMLDVDHFKRFNDTHGHAAGDTLLSAIGLELKNAVRREDIPCRYGGEELAVIMPDAPLDIAASRAQEICERVRKLHVVHANRSIGPVTISIGVAELRSHGTTLEEVIRAADRALYQAKSQGRDRVEIADGGPGEVVRGRFDGTG